ncbi:hypothetical protein [Microbacterium sp. A94]|uniref:hypothetical protein n=1 Tax=Microbacterium sp. A94 TaxID=3450717 RepID=UPI003F4446FF
MSRRRTRTIYRRRRLAVLSGLILLIAALAVGTWLVIAQPWADAATTEPTATSTPTPSVSKNPVLDAAESPSTEPSTDPGTEPSTEPTAEETPGIAPCQARDVTVEAVTNADTYASGVSPELSILLTNTSAADCTLDVGSSTQIFTVTSGADVWWDSRHCQANPSSMVVTLAAGQSVPSASAVVWDRTRSDVGTCEQENRPRAPAGGSSYHLAVSIGGFSSTVTRQFLLY